MSSATKPQITAMHNTSPTKFAWPAVIVVSIIPVILWAGMMPLTVRFSSPAIALGSIGKIAGLVAIVLYCVNLLFSTRARVIEQLFGGLNKAYVAHHLTGGIALCLALLHPLALSLKLAESSLHAAALQPDLFDRIWLRLRWRIGSGLRHAGQNCKSERCRGSLD
jgi:predicted ferric reductase